MQVKRLLFFFERAVKDRKGKKLRGPQEVSDENSHKRGAALGLFCDKNGIPQQPIKKGFEMPHTVFSFHAIFANLKV